MSELRLWEIDHPYYCSESNYYSNDPFNQYGSWQEFLSAEGDGDLDMNLVFRWDWSPDAYLDDDTPAGVRAYADQFGEKDHKWTLKLFYMGQRKGIFRPVEVSVCKADEPEVREWLTIRAEHMRRLWEPLLDVPVSDA